jgi:hypothetical protein
MADLLLDIYLDRKHSSQAPKSMRADFDISGDSILEFTKGSAAKPPPKQK